MVVVVVVVVMVNSFCSLVDLSFETPFFAFYVYFIHPDLI